MRGCFRLSCQFRPGVYQCARTRSVIRAVFETPPIPEFVPEDFAARPSLRQSGFIKGLSASSPVTAATLEKALESSGMGDYATELESAIRAVRLASVLCEVCARLYQDVYLLPPDRAELKDPHSSYMSRQVPTLNVDMPHHHRNKKNKRKIATTTTTTTTKTTTTPTNNNDNSNEIKVNNKNCTFSKTGAWVLSGIQYWIFQT
jgi:hypothetical protein